MTRPVIIVGAGGFGRELLYWLYQHPSSGVDWEVVGYIDDHLGALDGFDCPVPMLGSIQDHQPRGELLACGVALPRGKKAVVESLLARGGEFLTFVHPTVIQGGHVQIGRGSVICPRAVLTSYVRLGAFVTFNCGSSIGHDAVLGDYTTAHGHVDVTGNCRVGEGVILGSHASLIPGSKVGDWATVGAGSTVIMPVPAGATVFGSPAKRLV